MRGDNVCPYCGFQFEKPPKRKKKCPSCGKYVFVRSKKELFNRSLLTEKQALATDEFKVLLEYGVTKEDYFEKERQMKKKNGFSPFATDVIWNLYINLILKFSEDFSELSRIYYSQAIFLNKEKRNAFKVLQLSRQMELLIYKEQGFEKVRIIGGPDSCENCKMVRNKVFDIDYALEKMPVPVRSCTHKLYSEKYGFCRCSYLPYLPFMEENKNPKPKSEPVVKIKNKKKSFLDLFKK